jgi:hypothetical protein
MTDFIKGIVMENKARLDQLFKDRFHGASNIKGIRFQILYSILRAFELYDSSPETAIRLEGIEDIDLIRVNLGSLYIQVKTSDRDWGWSEFTKKNRSGQPIILKNFLEVMNQDPNAQFLLVSNFSYKGILNDLYECCLDKNPVLPDSLKGQLLRVFKDAGFPDTDISLFISKLSFQNISEDDVLRGISNSITAYFSIETGNEELYLLTLTGYFITKAEKRGTITKAELEELKLTVQDWISKGVANEAIKYGIIEKLDFSTEQFVDDFYEGKNTRPGHIVAGVDIKRPIWIENIEQSFERAKVCVILSSSGQGKSALLYRYAFDHYNPQSTFLLKTFTDEKMLGPLKSFIGARLKQGLTVLVLIDNLNYSTRYWHRLADEFAGEQVKFLISSREEDWFRYGHRTSGFIWEIIRPELSLEEAKGIFDQLKLKNKIAVDVPSAEWAYEKVRERCLLIEFVYLVTHGRMLEERLSEQIYEIERLKEDIGKIEFLRLISTAHAMGANPRISDIIKLVNFSSDIASSLKSLENEYVVFDQDHCSGLHLVRSEHLVRLLHANVYPLSETIAKLFNCLDMDNVEKIVPNVFTRADINSNTLVKTLAERLADQSLEAINRVIHALFIASESAYFQANKHIFDKAFEMVGRPGITFMAYSAMPASGFNLLEEQNRILGKDHKEIRELYELSRNISVRNDSERCEKHFFEVLLDQLSDINCRILFSDFMQLEIFSSWCRFYGIKTNIFENVFAEGDWSDNIYNSDINQAGGFLASLYNYSPRKYDDLFAKEKENLFSYFKLVSKTVTIQEKSNEIHIEFIAEPEGESDLSQQTMSRINNLRLFFPIYERYCGKALYPYDYPTDRFDPSIKETSKENLYLKSDTRKNSAWLELCEKYYESDSFYLWQRYWYIFRSDLLDTMEYLIRMYEKVYKGAKISKDFTNQMTVKANEALSHLRQIRNLRIAEEARVLLRSIEPFATSITNFLTQFYKHDPQNSEQKFSHLMRINLKDSIKAMPEAHKVFRELIKKDDDYFGMYDLDEKEVEKYTHLEYILDFYFEAIFAQTSHLYKEAQRHKKIVEERFCQSIKKAMKPLQDNGVRIYYPKGQMIEQHLVSLCIGFDVTDFSKVSYRLVQIALHSINITEKYDFLYILPLIQGKSYMNVAYRTNKDNIEKMQEGDFDDKTTKYFILPIEPPKEIYEILPKISKMPIPEMEVFNEFASMHDRMAIINKRNEYIKSRINVANPFEIKLEELYQQQELNEMDVIKTSLEAIEEKMGVIGIDNPAIDEWRFVCNFIKDELWQHKQEFANILVNSEFQNLASAYLNKKYLRIS